MKYCPACRNQYTDVTLRFCLQDGAVLHDGEVKQSTIDTVSFSDPVTADNILKTGEMKLFAPPNDQSKTQKWNPAPPKSALRREPEIKKSRSSRMLLLAAFPAVLAIIAVGLGGWLYFKNQNKTPSQSVNPAASATPEIAQNTPPANNSTSEAVLDDLSRTPDSNSETNAVSGSEDAKKEITDIIEVWRKATEARKLPDYLNRYAEKVDYFDKTGASASEIRAEAQKMFDAYSEIEITLTNLRVAVDADSKQATAVFDKEWSYETDKDLLEGKAHTKLRFQKNGSEWKIISEKHQKIYYMEN